MGKNSVESSLKRFFKRRVKITLGFVVAFMIMGTGVFAAEAIINKKGDNKVVIGQTEGYTDIVDGQIEINKGDKNNAISGSEVDLQDFKVILNGNIGSGNTITGNGQLIVNEEKSSALYVSSKITASYLELNSIGGKGIYTEGGGKNPPKVELNVSDIAINSKDDGIFTQLQAEVIMDNINSLTIKTGSDGYGIVSNGGGKVIINSQNVENSKLDISGGKVGISIGAGEKSSVDIKGFDKLEISGKYAGVATSYGSNALSSQKVTDGTINIEGNEIIIEGQTGVSLKGYNKKIGGSAESSAQSTVNIKGKDKVVISSTKVENGDAIKIDKGGIFNLTNTEDTDVLLNGNINIVENAVENHIVQGIANVNFKTSDSELNGSIITGENNTESNIEFSNGATWNNNGDSNVTNLTLDNGVINNGKDKDGNFTNIAVDKLLGTGGSFNLGAEIDENGTATSGKLTITDIENDNAQFNVNYTGDSDFQVNNEEKAKDIFEELGKNIQVGTGEKFNTTATLEEGLVSDSYTSDITVTENGNTEVNNVQTAGKNSMVEGISDLATINLLTWRQEMNSLNKRMGELRNSTGEHGVWSRVYTGKIENGDRYDNDYQTYQVGYDKKYSVDNGVMFIGGLVSYSKGETNYELGDGENYSVGAGIYATWLNNDGYFADVVLKQSRLHNKFDVMNKGGKHKQSGDYDNWGTSLSGQYGKRFDVNDKLFIEPSAELTLGRVEDTTYITSAGVNVHQDTMYSLVGNISTAVGYKFNDKGNIYTRVSLVREFQGDIDTYYEHNSVTNETHEDLADTWVEFGIGANYRFAEDLNIYVDLQKTGEATVDTEWQANLGFRYEF